MITIKDVEHIAKLARMALTEEEKVLYARQLGKIIQHFNQLAQLDTTGAEPLAHNLMLTNVMREDQVVSSPGGAVILANAPAQENGFFQVPRIGE